MEFSASFASDLFRGVGLDQDIDLRLFRQTPTDARTGELSGDGYPAAGHRVVLTDWTVANGVATFDTDEQFFQASAAISGITHVGGYVGTGPGSLKFLDQIASTSVLNGGNLTTGRPTVTMQGASGVETSFLNDLLNGDGLDQTLSIGLFTAQPVDARTNELSGNGYAAGSAVLADWTVNGAAATLRQRPLFTASAAITASGRPTHVGYYVGSGAGSLKFWSSFTAREIPNGHRASTVSPTTLTLDLTA